MTLPRSLGKPIYKSFKEFLRESNYGSLEKDERLINIYNDMVKFLIYDLKRIDSIPEVKIFVLPNFYIQQKYKDEKIGSLNIKVVIKTSKKNRYYDHFCDLAASQQITADRQQFQIILNFNQYLGESDKQYIGKLVDFFKEDSEEFLLHEIKHILDTYDEKFDDTKHKYISPTKENIRSGKYHSQKQEIYNMLISVISDLKKIKKHNPDITYSNAVKQSEAYGDIFAVLPVSYYNRIKAKLADFWYKNYSV